MNPRQQLAQYRQHLGHLASQVDDPSHGFFGPNSMAWRVSREGLLGLGALRALLMQIAHPKVAQAISDHSDYLKQPYMRAYKTLLAQQSIVFGSCQEATETLLRIYARHLPVRGRVSPVGEARGVSYSATDPVLLFWVHATLIDTVIRTQSTFQKPMSPASQEAFYQESRLFASLMGLDEAHVPPTLADFNAWMRAILAGPEIAVTPTARHIARSLLRLPLPVFWPTNYLLTAGMLPPKLRQQYGLRWDRPMRLLFSVGAAAVKALAARLPLRLRFTPKYWQALARCQQAAG